MCKKSTFSFPFLLLAVVLLGLISCEKKTQLTIDQLYTGFQEPGAAFRAKPFWSWNGDLQKDELIRQIHNMKEMGYGGYFMHSRTGLRTEYLGEKWFELINACADEGEKLGMESWLYDEDRWPSGTAGGLVCKNPDYRARFLSIRSLPGKDFVWNDTLFAAFSADLQGLNVTNCKRISKTTPPAEFADKTILVFNVFTKGKDSFFNNYTDVDRLNKEATQEFLRMTHERYKQECGDRLGRSILGIFTDEPHRQHVMTGATDLTKTPFPSTPWTGKLPEIFQSKFGYDIMDKLPDLFLHPEGNQTAQVKWHYMELLQELFLDNWVKPYYEWCRNNKLIFTGHFLHEDNLTTQSAVVGSLMRGYEYMDYPGIDVLTQNNLNYWLAKQVQSAARQTGKKWILSELNGVTGWQANFRVYKAIGDWQALFGVNLRCPHLSWYTMKGQAKRDYPASIFHQSAWWKENNYLETYYARLGYLLSQGDPVCDVLVINPVESVWAQVYNGWARGFATADSSVKVLEAAYRDVFHWLQGNQIDFDYADEEMLGRLYDVEKGPEKTPVLRVGKTTYTTVVVGKMTTVRSSTLKVLEEFMAAGGKVIFAGDPPTLVDALPSEKASLVAATADKVGFSEQELIARVKTYVKPAIQVIDPGTGKNLAGVFCQVKKDGDRLIVAAINVDAEKSIPEAVIQITGKGNISEWECETGKRYSVDCTASEGMISIPTSFEPSGEKIFVVSPEVIQNPEMKTQPTGNSILPLPGPYTYKLGESNVCVLDMARYQVDNKPANPETEILKVDQAVRKEFGMDIRSGNMVQPWFKAKFEPKPAVAGKVKLLFSFQVETLPQGPVELCLETPEEFRMKLNGNPLKLEGGETWIDIALMKFVLPEGMLKTGENVLEQEVDFGEDINLEAIYLLGNFGVKLNGPVKTITSLPGTLQAGDITTQGLPFYSGAITYELPVPAGVNTSGNDKVWLRLRDWEAACAKAGKEGKIIAWHPCAADITGEMKGADTLNLELILTRRNTFGPLHQFPFSRTTGPGNFTTGGKNFTMDYVLFSHGLLSSPELVVQQN